MGEDQREKKPAGRPRKYSGKRPTWTVRLEESIGNQVKELAAATGRSISEVCEGLINEGLRAPGKISELGHRNKFLELQQKDLVTRIDEMEQQLYEIAENYADQAADEDQPVEPQQNIVELIESAVERAVKRALQQKE